MLSLLELWESESFYYYSGRYTSATNLFRRQSRDKIHAALACFPLLYVLLFHSR